MSKSEWEAWKNASPQVKKEGIRLFTLQKFEFKVLETWHSQADDLHFVVREITFDEFMRKLNTG